jgi:hypothetical protein
METSVPRSIGHCRFGNFDDPRRARSFAGLLVTAIEGAYIRGRAERSAQPFIDAGKWLATLAEQEARA